MPLGANMLTYNLATTKVYRKKLNVSFISLQEKKSRIRETPNLLTDADSRPIFLPVVMMYSFDVHFFQGTDARVGDAFAPLGESHGKETKSATQPASHGQTSQLLDQIGPWADPVKKMLVFLFTFNLILFSSKF